MLFIISCYTKYGISNSRFGSRKEACFCPSTSYRQSYPVSVPPDRCCLFQVEHTKSKIDILLFFAYSLALVSILRFFTIFSIFNFCLFFITIFLGLIELLGQ